jgi:predicted ribosome quality control (RQC) complex YloA/Tae2 family protein
MKKNLSGLELRHIVAEMQELLNCRVAKIYQPTTEDVYIQFFGAKNGKKMLRISIPACMFLAETKELSPQSPYGFCQSLRKWIEGSRLAEITQQGMERIVELAFETREERLALIVELFSKGNIILMKKDHTIISCHTSHTYKERDIRPKQKYAFPKAAANPLDMDYEQYKKLLSKTQKESMGAFLAADLGMGQTYSDEICILAGIDKNKIALTEQEQKKCFDCMKSLLNKKPKPNVANGECMPFELTIFKDCEREYYPSYSQALEKIMNTATADRKHKEDKTTKERERIQRIIDMQESGISEMEKEIKDSQRKAELIYENYQEIKSKLEQANQDIKKLTREEMIEKHKLKELNLKDKKIIIEVS